MLLMLWRRPISHLQRVAAAAVTAHKDRLAVTGQAVWVKASMGDTAAGRNASGEQEAPCEGVGVDDKEDGITEDVRTAAASRLATLQLTIRPQGGI